MSSVDNRIVEMQFDNGQFEKGIQQSLKSLEALKKGLELDKSAKSLSNLEEAARNFSLEKLERGIEQVTDRFSTMGIIGMRVLQNITDRAEASAERFIRSVSVDQISSGFRKYEDRTKAVQTIVNATGDSLETVEGHLDKLMWFTDETSYSFTDMVSNVGKFTSMKIPLADSVTAMQGIATWAAKSGQGIGEASRAMYNLSQAMGAGAVKKIDWISINNAQMATAEFKETVIETAKALGVLNGEGKTSKGTLVNIENFAETLHEGWFTKDVLMDTLKKYGEYADEVYKIASVEGITAAEAMERLTVDGMELGESAFKAAQEAKTFTEAIEATKDAVSSGWMQSFNIIFGNYEQAKELWTDLANTLWDVFASGAEARNELLQGWADAGGRTKAIEGLTKILQALIDILNSAKQAFHEIIPEATVDDILKLSDALASAGDKIEAFVNHSIGYKNRHKVPKIFQDQKNAVAEFNEEIAKGAKGEDVKKFQQKLIDAGYSLDKFGADGVFGPETQKALKEYQKAMGLEETGVIDKATYERLVSLPGDVTAGWEYAYDEFDRYSESIQKFQRIIKGVAAVGKIAWKGLEFGGRIVLKILSALAPLGSALLTIAAGIGDCLVSFESWIEESGIFGEWIAWITDKLKPFQDGVQKVADGILDFFGFGDKLDVVDGKIQTFKGLWDQIKSSVKSSSAWTALSNALDKVKNSFSTLSPEAKSFFESIGTFLSTNFQTAIDYLATNVPIAVEKIATALTSVIDFIFGSSEEGNESEGFLSKVKTFFTDAYDLFVNNEDIQNAISSFLEWFGTVKAALSDFIFGKSDESGSRGPNLFERLWTFLSDLYTSITTNADLLAWLENAKTTLVEFGTNIKAFFEMIGKGIADFLSADTSGEESFGDKVKKRFEAFSEIGTLFSGVWDSVKGWFSGLLTGLSTFFKDLPESSMEIMKWVGSVGSILIALLSFNKFRQILGNLNNLIKGTNSKAQPFSRSMLELAGAFAIITGSILVLGKLMTKEELKQGLWAMGGIVGVFSILAVVLSKFFAIKINDKQNYGDVLQKIARSFLEVAGAILILTASIWLLSKMKWSDFLNGLGKMASIMGVIGLFVVFVNLLGGSKIDYKGLLELAGAVAILSILAWIIGGMDLKRFYTGVGGIGAIMLLLLGFSAILALINNKIGQASTKGLLKIVGAIAIMALMARILGGMNTGRFWSGFGRLAAIAGLILGFALVLTLITKMAGGKIDTKPILVIAGAIAALAIVLWALGELDPEKFKQGAIGIGIITGAIVLIALALAAVSKLAGSGGNVTANMLESALGVGGALMILAGAVAGIVWGLGKINELSNGGFVESLEQGGLVMQAIADAFAPFSEHLDALGIAVGGFLALAELGALLHLGPSMFMSSLALGASLAILAAAVTLIIGGLGAWNDATDGGLVAKLESGGEVLAAIGGAVGSFAGALKSAFDAETGVDPAADVQAFADAISAFHTAITGLDTDETLDADKAKALEVAASIYDFYDQLALQYPDNTASLTTFGTNLGNSIEAFGTGIGAFQTGVAGLSSIETLEADEQTAMDVASSLSGFFTELQATLPADEDSFALYSTKLDSTFDDIDKFSTSVSNFQTKIAGIADTTILADTLISIAVMKSISKFFAAAAAMELEQNAKGLKWLWSEDTKVSTLISNISLMATTMQSSQSQLSGLNKTTIETDMDKAIAVVRKVAEFASEVETDETLGSVKDFSSLDSKMNNILGSIFTIGDQLSNFQMSMGDFDVDTLSSVTTSLETISDLISTESLDSSNFIKNLDADIIVNAVNQFSNKLTSSMTDNSNSISAAVESFNAAGSQVANAFNSGLSSTPADTTGIASMCSSALEVAKGYASEFRTTGMYLARGIANGLNNNAGIVEAAARSVMAKALAAANAAAQINSPSRLTEEMGMYLDMGLANGLIKYSNLASSSAQDVTQSVLETARGSLSTLAGMISEDMDADPVIRPVVDLSRVDEGARAIGGILGGSRTVSVATSVDKAQSVATTIGRTKANQNGSGSTSSVDNSNTSSVNITGNSFNIRSDNDIRLLAAELGQFVKSQNRSVGASVM